MEQEKNNLVKDFNLKPILYHQTKLQIINLLNNSGLAAYEMKSVLKEILEMADKESQKELEKMYIIQNEIIKDKPIINKEEDEDHQ